MALRKLSAEEFAVWLLFSTIISLQSLAELGFGVTFARVLAYAMGGAERLDGHETRRTNCGEKREPNWRLIEQILGTMRLIYARLGLILAVLLVACGTLALWRPIGRTDDPTGAWVGWAVVCAVTLYTFHANQYANYLLGTNHIALIRRWETLFALGSVGAMFLVLAGSGRLLTVVLAHQGLMALGAFRNGRLARWTFEGRFRNYPPKKLDQTVYGVVWSSAWRSGIGTAMSWGLIQVSALFHAQSRDLASVNSYLLGLRLVQATSQFSQAPFYSKLPMMARLYAEGKREQMIALAKRGMNLAYWSFVLPAALLGLLGPWALREIGGAAFFPSSTLWILLTSAILVERYGAMHLQLFSTTNRIIWHVVNGVTGLVICAFWIVLYPRMGATGLALGLLLGNAAFFSWYCARRSHCEFGLDFPRFDLGWAGVPLLTFLVGVIVTIEAYRRLGY